jgi:hypothetical protein
MLEYRTAKSAVVEKTIRRGKCHSLQETPWVVCPVVPLTRDEQLSTARQPTFGPYCQGVDSQSDSLMCIIQDLATRWPSTSPSSLFVEASSLEA